MAIEAIVSGGDGRDQRIELGSYSQGKIGDDKLLWVDLAAPDDDELERAVAALHLSEGTAERLRDDIGRPRATVHSDCFEVVVAVVVGERGRKGLQLLVGDNWVLTRHPGDLRFLEQHRTQTLDERELGQLRSIDFAATILDWHLETFFDAAEGLEREIDELDDAALRREDDLLERLVSLRGRISHVRRVLSQHREPFAELGRPDFLPKESRDTGEQLRALSARLERAADAIIQARELLLGSFDIHMTRTAQRTNDIMRVLTVASVVLLPSVVIAGVMGMNFRIFLFDEPGYFWVVLAAMLVLALGTLAFARWRRWI